MKPYSTPKLSISHIKDTDIITDSAGGEIDPWQARERFESIDDDDF